MRTLVVYESMFGNTRDVAVAIADGIGKVMPVEVLEVGQAPRAMPGDVVLLIVGGPTHAHGLSTPDSRADSARRAGDRLVSHGTGLREWLDGLSPAASAIPAAAFDTRLKGPVLIWGSAAKAVAKRLRTLGYREATAPESFLVGGPTGPMFDRVDPDELERARAWGASLPTSVPAGTAAR